MKSVMSHRFSDVPPPQIQRSSFNRSHGYKTTFDSGLLIPFFIDEALPGDSMKLRHTLFARLATPKVPVMDNMFLDTFYFAVPNRILWENWENFMTDTNGSYTVPQCDPPAGGWQTGDIGDYFGLPVGKTGFSSNALFFRAYQKIFIDWFADQNLILPAYPAIQTGDGPDAGGLYSGMPEYRAKRHDYFTSCLPWPQKGTAVDLPLGTTAPVVGDGTAMGLRGNATPGVGLYMDSASGSGRGISASQSLHTQPVGTGLGSPSGITQDVAIGLDSDPAGSGVICDLTSATAATINDLRLAFQIQKVFEKDARGGTRYVEIIKNHFGVTSPDFRMQRAEYLGGSSQRINITPVPQTGETGTTPQGTLAGYGVGVDNGRGFSKSFTEHTIIIGIMNVRVDLTYQQGMDRMHNRETRWDYYWPSFAHLGEQAVLNKEIVTTGTPGLDDAVFGYQERYAEYRYKPSKVTGLFRSSPTAGSTLDFWHLSEEFSGGVAPTLSASFIQSSAVDVIDRVIAVPSEPQFILDAFFDFICARPMPTYSVPGMIDHF